MLDARTFTVPASTAAPGPVIRLCAVANRVQWFAFFSEAGAALEFRLLTGGGKLISSWTFTGGTTGPQWLLCPKDYVLEARRPAGPLAAAVLVLQPTPPGFWPGLGV